MEQIIANHKEEGSRRVRTSGPLFHILHLILANNAQTTSMYPGYHTVLVRALPLWVVARGGLDGCAMPVRLTLRWPHCFNDQLWPSLLKSGQRANAYEKQGSLCSIILSNWQAMIIDRYHILQIAGSLGQYQTCSRNRETSSSTATR